MTWLQLGDNITVVLVAVYAVLAVLYFLAGQHNKALYWVGAFLLTLGVLRMA